MNEHPLCCDCDECLNGAGGYTLPGVGRAKKTRPGWLLPRVAIHLARRLNARTAVKRGQAKRRIAGQAAKSDILSPGALAATSAHVAKGARSAQQTRECARARGKKAA